MKTMKGTAWKVSERDLIERINQEPNLLYYFDCFNGLQTTIRIEDDWFTYIHENQAIIKGWLQYHMICYLQKRNPSVPGIADKLYPPQERKLEKVKKYWKLLLNIRPVQDIYGQVVAISTIVAVTVAAIALIVRMVSRNQRAVDEATSWLKRIVVTWIVLNTLGFIVAYLQPLIAGGQYTGG